MIRILDVTRMCVCMKLSAEWGRGGGGVFFAVVRPKFYAHNVILCSYRWCCQSFFYVKSKPLMCCLKRTTHYTNVPLETDPKNHSLPFVTPCLDQRPIGTLCALLV